MARRAILRRLVKSPGGGWDVKASRSERSLGDARRKRDAERLARDMVRAAGAGSVAIYGTDGVLQLNWTYTAEPPALLRGKVFEDEVVASWDRRHCGDQLSGAGCGPAGWHPELAPVAGKLLKKAPRTKGTTGRLDILVDVDPEGTAVGDDLEHAYRALLEVKSTKFDRVPLERIKRTIARHRRQIVAYIGTQLDLGNPDVFADDEAFVAPGIVYAHTSSDPVLRAYIED